MRVTVITATANPMDVIGIAAGMCYGKPTPSPKRVRRCAENGHMSVFEHATATLQIEGDARYLLPEATKTSLVMTINARSLQNFLTLRLDSHAQWEIRELAVTIERELERRCDGQWPELIRILREARND